MEKEIDYDIVQQSEKEQKEGTQINLDMILQDTNSNMTSGIQGKLGEPTGSASDLVNYESFEDKGSSLRFLKRHEKEERSKDDYLKISPPQQEISSKNIIIPEIKFQAHLNKNDISDMNPVREETPPLSPPQELNESNSSSIVKVDESEREYKLETCKNNGDYVKFLESISNNPKEIIPCVPLPEKISTQEDNQLAKQKEMVNDKARIEKMEKQKKREIEEIKRKAKEKEEQKKKIKAAINIQKFFRGFKMKKAYKIIMQDIKTKRNKETIAAIKILTGLQKWHKYKLKEKEDLLKRYMNHCAVFIQKIYRGFSAKIRYEKLLKKRKRFIQIRKALLIGWKTRKILTHKKIQLIKQAIIGCIKNDEKKKRVDSFIRMFYVLYTTGQWTNSRNIPVLASTLIIYFRLQLKKQVK